MLISLLKLTNKRLKNIKTEHWWLTFILFSSFIARIIYVYYFTDYKNYLFTDMGGYWSRALDRYNGKVFDMSQWTSWATFFHFYLTEIFKLLAFLNLFNKKLEIVLFLNVVYSTISIYFVYLISLEILKKKFHCLLLTFLYAFTYFFIYLNALVMSENLSVPLLIISFYLILSKSHNKKALFLAGLLLAIATALRPAHGLIGLPLFLYILFSRRYTRGSLISAIVFASAFFLIIYLVIQENIRISNGELKSLAGYSGVVFFHNQCKVLHIKSFYKGHILEIVPPLFLAYPELAKMEFSTTHPFHHQEYFYKLGFECMKKNPNIFFDNLISLQALFWGCFFPDLQGASGREFFCMLWSCIIIFMTSLLGFLYFLLRDKKVESPKILLLISIPVCILITSFLYGSEQRYLLPAYFAIYLLFFIVASHVRDYANQLAQYLIVLALIFYFLVYH